MNTHLLVAQWMQLFVANARAPLDDRDAPFSSAVSIMNAKIECTRAREITFQLRGGSIMIEPRFEMYGP